VKISASVKSEFNNLQTTVQTNSVSQELKVPPKATGYGSSINGGELLMLSLATCFCNDIYREAAKRKILITSVGVEVNGEFGGEGEPGFNFTYRADVVADAPDDMIKELIEHTDRVAEIHNTLRKGVNVTLKM